MTKNDIIAAMNMNVAEAWSILAEAAKELGWSKSRLIKSLEDDEISGEFELHMAAAVLGIDGQAAIALRQAANLLSLN